MEVFGGSDGDEVRQEVLLSGAEGHGDTKPKAVTLKSPAFCSVIGLDRKVDECAPPQGTLSL